MIDSVLGHYKITAKLGQGGMGEVWRAEDTKLGREVALKMLPEDFADDPDRHARFEREAKVLASLNHANIATLHALEHLEGQHVLVMELVEGEGLDDVIARGPIPIDEAIVMAQQIAEALEAAHEAGIVHRDLKPANIRVRPDGTVKVLDFGLAKTWEADGGDSSLSLSPTMTRNATMEGVILGTAAYMSPEQARGKKVDRRSDVWAFGVVLWEMLTGRKLFEGQTVSDVLASVLKEAPDLDALPRNTPPAVRRLVTRCLEREPRDRLQWIGDARLDLAEAMRSPEDAAKYPDRSGASTSRVRELLAWSATLLALTLATFFWWQPDEVPDHPLTRFAVSVGDKQTLSFIDVPIIALSPNGQTLAFVARDVELEQDRIYLRRLKDHEVRPLSGTEGGSNPFFSPHGEHLAFFAGGKLKKISIDGGAPITLADAPNPRGGVWLPDDSIVFAPAFSSGLSIVAGSGGNAETLLDLDLEKEERTYRFPDILPGGDAVIFTVGKSDSPNDYNEAQIVLYSPDTGKRHVLIEGANMARFVGRDTIIYSRAGVLYSIAFDPDRLETQGEGSPVIEGVGGDSSSGAGYFAVASNGTFAWVEGSVTDIDALLTIVDRQGTATRLPLPPNGFHQPRFSPDGKQLAMTVGPGRQGVGGDVWVYSFESKALNRFTFGGNEIYPVWTADSRGIAYLSYVDEPGILLRRADGSGSSKRLTPEDSAPLFPESFSPDGKTLAYTRIGRTPDLYLITEGEEARLFEVDTNSAAISPDGRWIAYGSPGAANSRVYVRPIEGEGKWQVSPGFGSYPRWSGDGRHLYYIDIGGGPTNRPLVEVDIADGDTFRAGPPRVVIDELAGRFVTTTAPATNWDVSPEGDRFVFVEFDRDERAGEKIEVAINWAQNLSVGSP